VQKLDNLNHLSKYVRFEVGGPTDTSGAHRRSVCVEQEEKKIAQTNRTSREEGEYENTYLWLVRIVNCIRISCLGLSPLIIQL